MLIKPTTTSSSASLILLVLSIIILNDSQTSASSSESDFELIHPQDDFNFNFSNDTANETSNKRTYEGYSVLRFHPGTRDQLSALEELVEKWPEVDFWSTPNSHNNASVDLMVPPESRSKLVQHMSHYHMPSEVLIEDVEK